MNPPAGRFMGALLGEYWLRCNPCHLNGAVLEWFCRYDGVKSRQTEDIYLNISTVIIPWEGAYRSHRKAAVEHSAFSEMTVLNYLNDSPGCHFLRTLLSFLRRDGSDSGYSE